MKMINYFPNKRTTAEDLINHRIFNDLPNAEEERKKAFTDLRSYNLVSTTRPADLSMPAHMLLFQDILRINAAKFTFDTGIAVNFETVCPLNEDERISIFYHGKNKEKRIQEKFKPATNFQKSDTIRSDDGWYSQEEVETTTKEVFKQGIDKAKDIIISKLAGTKKKDDEKIVAVSGPVNTIQQAKMDDDKYKERKEEIANDVLDDMQDDHKKNEGNHDKQAQHTEDPSQEIEYEQQSTSRSNNATNNNGRESQDDDIGKDGTNAAGWAK